MRTCTICGHTDRNDIDEALLDGRSLRNIAKQYKTSTTSLFRHKKDHIPTALAQTVQATTELQAETLFDRLRSINTETKAILQEAREAKSSSIALAAINRIEHQIELEAKILGQLDDSVKVAVGFNLTPEPEWNFSELTNEELEEYTRLLAKVNRVN